MVGATSSLDYPTLTKRGFALGVALFVIGALGEAGLAVAGVTVPQWEQTLLFDMEILGILIGLLAPFVFGVLLPLTE